MAEELALVSRLIVRWRAEGTLTCEVELPSPMEQRVLLQSEPGRELELNSQIFPEEEE